MDGSNRYTLSMPEIGVPPNHPFIDGFSLINHPAIGDPLFMDPPISFQYLQLRFCYIFCANFIVSIFLCLFVLATKLTAVTLQGKCTEIGQLPGHDQARTDWLWPASVVPFFPLDSPNSPDSPHFFPRFSLKKSRFPWIVLPPQPFPSLPTPMTSPRLAPSKHPLGTGDFTHLLAVLAHPATLQAFQQGLLLLPRWIRGCFHDLKMGR